MAAGSRVVVVGARLLTGRVMSQGQPLPFASVRLEGTRIGVAANAEGMYRIDDVSAGAWTVVASMVGCARWRRVEMQGDGAPSWTLSSRRVRSD